MSSMQMRGFFGVASALAMATAVFVSGCSDDNGTVQPPDQLAPPTNLTFENEDGNKVFLSWTLSPDESFDELDGYNVYRDTASMINLSGADLAARKIMELPKGTTSYRDSGLADSTKYFYGVRTRRTNEDVSISSNEIDTAAYKYGGGLANIYEFAVAGQPSGFDVTGGTALSMIDANATMIDFYLGTEDDGPTGALLLKSPSLASDNAPWNQRVAQFKVISASASFTTTDGFQLSVAIPAADDINDNVIAVKLPVDEKCAAAADAEYFILFPSAIEDAVVRAVVERGLGPVEHGGPRRRLGDRGRRWNRGLRLPGRG